MGDENPIRTLGDYFKPSHEGYRNTIELPVWNNVVPIRSDTIQERTRLFLFQFSLRGQARNWIERLPAGSISNGRILLLISLLKPSGRTEKLCNDIPMFQQYQGSDINIMPLSIYKRLIDERPAETDIRLSLANHSYIYPLGIAQDVLIDVVGYVYPMDFVILDIKEDEKWPFILGTPFLTTAKVVIKFDKGTITLRSGKSKMSFHRIPKPLCRIEKGIKNNIEPIAPTMTVNRLVLEWEEKIINNERPISAIEECEVKDEGEVTLYLMRRSLEVLRKFLDDDSWRKI
nr:hypothetical protein [Tanacetum cinerariifolium]